MKRLTRIFWSRKLIVTGFDKEMKARCDRKEEEEATLCMVEQPVVEVKTCSWKWSETVETDWTLSWIFLARKLIVSLMRNKARRRGYPVYASAPCSWGYVPLRHKPNFQLKVIRNRWNRLNFEPNFLSQKMNREFDERIKAKRKGYPVDRQPLELLAYDLPGRE